MKRSVIKTLFVVASLGWLGGWAALIGVGFTHGFPNAAVSGIVVALSPIPLGWAALNAVRRRDVAKDELTAKLRKELRSSVTSRAEDQQIRNLESQLASNAKTSAAEEARINEEISSLHQRLERSEAAFNRLHHLEKQTRARVDQVKNRTEQLQSQTAQMRSQSAQLKSQASQTAKLTDMTQQTLHNLGASLQAAEDNLRAASLRILKLASRQGIKGSQGMSQEELGALLLHSLRTNDGLAEGLLTREMEGAPNSLSLTELRQLMKSLRHAGYLREASKVMGWIAERSGKDSDNDRARIMESEALLFEGAELPELELPIYRPYPESTVVLHLVGKSLPETQTGYTLRTHYTARAISKLGVEPVVAVQVGGDGIQFDTIDTHFVDGIQYCSLPGPIRNTVPWDLWIERNIRSFAELVCSLRPAVIHAHSDFFNALIAQYVGDRYGIPVVNETRGFWEESWLSRTINAQGEEQFDELVEAMGLPLAYTGRRALEAKMRSASSTVVTLAHVMDEHIEKTAEEYGLPQPQVLVVPNAVESRSFPVVEKDPGLLSELDIPENATIVGYISSIVEYEGIDTLIRGFYELVCAFKAFEDLCEASSLPLEIFRGTVHLDEVTNTNAFLSNHGQTETADGRAESTTFGLSRRFDVINGRPYEDEGSIAEDKKVGEAADAIPERLDIANPESNLERVLLGQHYFDPLAFEETTHQLQTHLQGMFPGAYKDEGFAAELLGKVVDELSASQSSGLPDLRLLIVGDGAERLKLESIAADLGIEDRITFTGRVPHEDILRYYGLIDVFVVPRKSSDVTELVTPLKPFEAMSTGRACVFSNVRALQEIADEAKCVNVFEADNHHSLATTLLPIVVDRETIKTMGRQSARWVRDARSWDLNALSYVELYQELGLVIDVPKHATLFRDMTVQGRHPRLMLELLERAPWPHSTGWFTTTKVVEDAKTIITEGWRLAKRPRLKFEQGFDWMTPGKTDRTWGSRLHQWKW